MAATRAVANRRPVAAVGPLCDLLEDELTREAAAQLAIEFVGKKGAYESLAGELKTTSQRRCGKDHATWRSV